MTTVSGLDRDVFIRDGVVCFRGALSGALVDSLREAVEEAMAARQLVDLSAMARSLGSSAGASGGFHAGVDHYRSIPAFEAFALRSELPVLIAELLGATSLYLYEDSVLVKEPNTPQRTEWHQDLGYFHVAGEQICTTWCPLDPATAASGAVEYVVGSHLWGQVFKPNYFISTQTMTGTEGEKVPAIDGTAHRVVSFDTEPGDVVVHHARTVHGAPGNSSPTLRRRAVSVRYCGDDARVLRRPGAPVKDFQTALHDGDELACGYRNARLTS